jgi:hypothetical protein
VCRGQQNCSHQNPNVRLTQDVNCKDFFSQLTLRASPALLREAFYLTRSIGYHEDRIRSCYCWIKKSQEIPLDRCDREGRWVWRVESFISRCPAAALPSLKHSPVGARGRGDGDAGDPDQASSGVPKRAVAASLLCRRSVSAASALAVAACISLASPASCLSRALVVELSLHDATVVFATRTVAAGGYVAREEQHPFG